MVKTEVVTVDPKSPDKEAIKKAADIIRMGGLVAFPTETVYGLGADYLNNKALDKLYEVKDRPRNKPFTVHIADLNALDRLSCRVTVAAEKLIKRFWPGPLTLIFNTKSGAKIGVRMPSNRVALDFISACGTPIVAPSANISGERPPTGAEEVLSGLGGKIDLVLDGGKTEIGTESTVLDISIEPCKILRAGAVPDAAIKKALE